MPANNINDSSISEAKKTHSGDYEEVNPDRYRSKFMFHWNHMCDFEDITTRGPMSHTDIDKPYDATTLPCLEIYSWKVAELRGGLRWPLDVFGFVALRDSLDHKRNFIFNRDRDDPQRLTATDSALELTGPVRAVQLCMHIEAEFELG